jgi:2',3'-cyclic-nucleotide 2'-phosphodiesterase (5'-nucleotidase family)
MEWIEARVGALTVGITGVSAAGVGFLPAPEYAVEPPEPAAEAALTAHADQADVVILLAFQAIDEARRLAERDPRIDVVIDAFHHSEVVPPFTVGEAVWVKSSHETLALGELRLWIEGGRVVRALDRKIDLDPDIPGQRAMTDIAVQARQEIEAAERDLWGP